MNNNYFTINTTWMVPQEYFVDIKIETNGETNIFGSELNFHVVNRVKWYGVFNLYKPIK